MFILYKQKSAGLITKKNMTNVLGNYTDETEALIKTK